MTGPTTGAGGRLARPAVDGGDGGPTTAGAGTGPTAARTGAGPTAAGAGAGPPVREPAGDAERAVVAAQLGRPPRGTRAVAHRCPCGLPDVVETTPRLPDGTPFPTLFYLTCPRAAGACSRLESAGVMRQMQDRLVVDPRLSAAYAAAHRDYLARREAVAVVPEIAGVSAGGMPTRVKCLHVHLAHSLAAGPGVNPLGDEVLELVPPWWADGRCVQDGESCAGGPSVENEGSGVGSGE